MYMEKSLLQKFELKNKSHKQFLVKNESKAIKEKIFLTFLFN